MRNWLVGLLGAVMLFTTGCGSMIVKKPQVLAVKKLAIVSVYANTDIHDVEAKEGTQVNLLKALVTAVGAGDDDIESNELIQVATYGLKAFGEELEGVGAWQVVPPKQVIANAKFQALTKADDNTPMGGFLNALRKAATASWVTPPGMPYIPVSSLVETGGSKTIVFGQKDPMVEARERLAELCKQLNVDAVAVIGLDLAYKRGFLSGMSATGLLDKMMDIRGSATPMVAADVVVVTKDGLIAVENLYANGGVERAEAKSAPMLKKNQPSLTDPKGESIKAYFEGIQKYAAAVKTRMIKELAEK